MVAVSNLSSKLTLNTQEFTSGVNQAGQEASRFGSRMNRINRGSNQAAGGFRNQGFAIQQLAFAAEDAAAVYGTSGLAGAFRASANNLSMFAMLMNPVAGIITSIGIAISAAVLPSLMRWANAADAAKERQKALNDEAQKEIGRRQGLIQDAQGRANVLKSGDVKALEDERHKIEAEWNATKSVLEERRRKIIEDQKRIDEFRNKFLGGGLGKVNELALFPWINQSENNIKALKKSLGELDEQLRGIGKQEIPFIEQQLAKLGVNEFRVKLGMEPGEGDDFSKRAGAAQGGTSAAASLISKAAAQGNTKAEDQRNRIIRLLERLATVGGQKLTINEVDY